MALFDMFKSKAENAVKKTVNSAVTQGINKASSAVSNAGNKKEEIIFSALPTSLEEFKALIKKFTDIINNDGKVESVDELGKRRLAYEIAKNKEGFYAVFNFEAKPELIAELERNYRIDDSVMKFITIKKED